jgi:PRTRC genetic system protein B
MVAVGHDIFSSDHLAVKEPAPLMALVFSGIGDNLSAVARHGIENGKLGVGAFVSPHELLDMVATIVDGRGGCQGDEILPPNVLVNNSRCMMWHQPSRFGWFWHHADGDRRGFKIKWPALVFEVDRLSRTMRCVALATNKRPDALSPVYNLPMPNAYDGGGFCLGSAVLPRVVSVATMGDVEACVYDAVKTHSSNPQAIRNGENPTSYWTRKAKETPDVPPSIRARDLTQIGTLGSWMCR